MVKHCVEFLKRRNILLRRRRRVWNEWRRFHRHRNIGNIQLRPRAGAWRRGGGGDRQRRFLGEEERGTGRESGDENSFHSILYMSAFQGRIAIEDWSGRADSGCAQTCSMLMTQRSGV